MAIQDLLTEWARWQATERGVGYPTRTPFDRLRGSSVKSAGIPDDVALGVDAAVSRLRARCPDQAEVLEEHYLRRRSLARIGRSRGISRQTAALVLGRAETAVEWILAVSAGIE